MKRTRLEVFSNGVWREVDLFEDLSIKYNKISNRIGDYSKRDLSHSNTFSIPSTSVNIDIFQLNRFNPATMARSLNTRYECRYFLDEVIFDFGFLVINNTKRQINVNFISSQLDILDKLKSTRWSQLFTDLANYTNPAPGINLDTYLQDIAAYDLSTVGGQSAEDEYFRGTDGFTRFCLFPNTLNVLGDEFNEDVNGNREDDTLNPLQSRPIWSMIGMIDVAFNVDGFQVIYDDGLIDTLRTDYYVSDRLFQNSNSDIVNTVESNIVGSVEVFSPFPTTFTGEGSVAQFDSNVVTTLDGGPINGLPNIDDLVLVPLSNDGDIIYSGTFSNTGLARFFTVWEPITPGDPVVIDNPTNTIGATVTVDKRSATNTVPVGSNGTLLGYILFAFTTTSPDPPDLSIDGRITETDTASTGIDIDEYGQMDRTQIVNLLQFMPDKTLIEVIKPMLVRHGLLWDINTDEKTVFIYNYNRYINNIDSATDISRFFIDGQIVQYDTDYGSDYGRVNNIALDSPFRGNTQNITINNNNELSKYEEYKENHVENLRDVSEVIFVDNTNEPYFEYTHEGEGVVFVNNGGSGLINLFAQALNSSGQWFEPFGPNEDIFPFFVQNVNYASLPDGVRAWYDIIDRSLRATAQFLFPPDFISNLDITLPVFVQQLNGYYIVEEVEEYIDGCTPVRVRLIKINL